MTAAHAIVRAAGPVAVTSGPRPLQDLVARYSRPVPRYTSYPTAPQFGPQVDGEVYAGWLAALPDGARASIYLHVPFCAELCLYCGCNTSVARRYTPVAAYAERLRTEIARVAALIPGRLKVSHLHWGGGTPTLLSGADMIAIMADIRTHFDVDADAELAIEVDPRVLSDEMVAALAASGLTRASLGVQDFDPAVQEAIGRHQSFEETEKAAKALRAAGVGSLNLDLIYGLPHQTVASVLETVRTALALAPDRIAVFGYAHVPWMKKHQALIPEQSLPGAAERLAQAQAITALLEAEGYVAIGLDHFARPDDAMARRAGEGTLRRNFQGYTTDDAPILLGFGASAIGMLPQGYVQNLPATPAWHAALEAGRLPIARGLALTAEDRLRRDVIERLMCDGEVDLAAVLDRHGFPADTFAAEITRLAALEADGLVARTDAVLTVPAPARIFTRTVAAVFDAYLPAQENAAGPKRHAAAI
ncbi:oxygen-independent coproporphyrinogen III oxidase [Azorhizobium doebereinerae]|uniref:oxygen-independent coproporphyrinogen III oxidase n=1 Tax=Azorhizobium doebereinerae TaxID=281091 RepID=UPI00041B15D3|nr:oxygen-independent coproporphyrinogen III oxidase [Azorhizobium doebereinerae]